MGGPEWGKIPVFWKHGEVPGEKLNYDKNIGELSKNQKEIFFLETMFNLKKRPK